MDDFGHFGTDFAKFWSNLGHFWTESLLSDYFYTLKLLLEPVFCNVKYLFDGIIPAFAVGFRWNEQDASRARIFSWSGLDL